MNKKVFNILFLLLFAVSFVKGQDTVGSVSPNFKVTDIFGKYHNLYSDYLSEGKYVFMDFFTNTCTYCQYYAPIIDSAYRELGCGCGNIDFFAMNLYEQSTDSSVLYFITKYHITFNPVSAEGGSAYTGEIFDVGYTPYFIIVSPDTTIACLNPYFQTAQQLIDTLLNLGIVPADCQGTQMRYFEIWDANHNYISVGNIDVENNLISVQIPDTVDITNLIAFFIPSANANVFIDTIPQISGKTKNDFSDTVIYKVVAEIDTLVSFWKVVVNQYPTNVLFKEKHFYTYPNPTTDFVIIPEGYENRFARIYNSEGKLIMLKQVKNNKIDISKLGQGLYLIYIYKENSTPFSGKIIVK